jgi:hypothetical protein
MVVEIRYVGGGSPWENPCIESFICRFGQECLNAQAAALNNLSLTYGAEGNVSMSGFFHSREKKVISPIKARKPLLNSLGVTNS